jgi:hypothetical protein
LPAKDSISSFATLTRDLRKFALNPPAGKVGLERFAGFWIFDADQPGRRQLPFSWVLDGECDQVVSLAANRSRPFKIEILKIGEEENDCFPGCYPAHKLQCVHQVGAPLLRFEEKNLPDNPQGMTPALLRRDVKLGFVCEKQKPNIVVIVDRAKGQETRNFGG